MLRELLADTGQVKVTYDCHRLRGLLALLQVDVKGGEGGQSVAEDGDGGGVGAPPCASLLDLQLAAEHEDGGGAWATDTFAFLTAAAQRGWAPAYQKGKVTPAAALLLAAEGLQTRAGWGPLGMPDDAEEGGKKAAAAPALAVVRRATALRVASIRRALARGSGGGGSGGEAPPSSSSAAALASVPVYARCRPLLFDPRRRRLASLELLEARDGQGALARGLVAVNENVEPLYALVPPRLFGGRLGKEEEKEKEGGREGVASAIHPAGYGPPEEEEEEEEEQGEAEQEEQEPGWREPAVVHALMELVLDLGQRPRAKLRGRRERCYLHPDPSVVS